MKEYKKLMQLIKIKGTSENLISFVPMWMQLFTGIWFKHYLKKLEREIKDYNECS
jgi:hypothetical protein